MYSSKLLRASSQVLGSYARAFSSKEISINGTARLIRLKVDGEANAMKAQDLMFKAHQEMKKHVKGYVGSTRYVCKAEWDMYLFLRFANLDSLKAFMGSDVKEKKIEPIIVELQAIALGGKTNSQNFVADDW